MALMFYTRYFMGGNMEMHVEGMRQPTHTHEELTKEWSIFLVRCCCCCCCSCNFLFFLLHCSIGITTKLLTKIKMSTQETDRCIRWNYAQFVPMGVFCVCVCVFRRLICLRSSKLQAEHIISDPRTIFNNDSVYDPFALACYNLILAT